MTAFASNIHAELLKNLSAQNSAAAIPEFFDQYSCPMVLVSCRVIVRIHQNVGVDEAFIVHAVRPAKLEGSSPDQNPLGAGLRHACALDHIAGARARFLRASQRAAR